MVRSEDVQATIGDEALDELRARFKGELLRPGDERYDEARKIWNGAVDRFPSLVARCVGVADVIAAVRFARERDLMVSVRAGGHGVAGHAVSDGGMMIDLSPMKGIWVDPSQRIATAQAGVSWGLFDHDTQAFGLATTGGLVTSTGIAGLTLGGGIGWLMRTHGLTIDNLLGVDLVTAEGELVRASQEQNTDLFWGLRGGGGNFGIATSFTYRLHPVGPTVLAGPVMHPMDRAPELLRFYRDWIETVPPELTTAINLRRAPAVPFVPEEFHGAPVVAIVVCYAGEIETGLEVVRPLREVGSPIVDLVAPKPYVAHQSMFDPTVPQGWHYYWKSWELEKLSDAAIGALVDHASGITSPLSQCPIYQLGGAVEEFDEEGTAYSNRHAAHNINIASAWLPEDEEPERHLAWTRKFWEALAPYSVGSAYVNFLGDEGEDRVRAAYGPAKFDRLVALKDEYDPTNFFRLNQNIKPST